MSANKSPSAHLLSSELLAALRKAVGANFVLDRKEDLAVYECDAETLDLARPDCVVLPKSTEEVSAVIKLANRYKIPIVPRGAGTGLSGGATAIRGGICLALSRMTKVIEVDPIDMIAVVEAGVTNVAVSEAARQYNLYFAPDPSSQIASTIGGNVAENAGGPHTLKYGMTTNHVLGLKLVLSDGSIVSVGGRCRDRLAPDLLGVLVGSEGTLAMVTEATLQLVPRPSVVETLLSYFPSLAHGGQAVSQIVASGVVPAAMEMVDSLTLNAVEDAHQMGLDRKAGALLIIELDGSKEGILDQRQIVEKCLQANSVLSTKWAAGPEERARIWKARKSAFGALGRITPHAYVLDGVIPRSKLSQAIEKIAAVGQKYNVIIANIYHAGDGNLHPAILFDRNDQELTKRVIKAGYEILETCAALGGTLSGEHGIGIEKLSEMAIIYSVADMKAMQRIHDTFNPEGLLNPGKAIPSLKGCGESGMRPLLRFNLVQS